MKVLITAAAGNLGGFLTRHLLDTTDLELNLLVHKKDVSDEIRSNKKTLVFRGDLARKETLFPCLENVDVVVHFAGVLFKHNPQKFLPITNTQYFKNLCEVGIERNVRRIILVSFPHVEGGTTKESPAVGRCDGKPDSVHARTRLEEEKYLFEHVKGNGVESVSLRVGMVYGRGIKMIDAGRWLAKKWLLGIWKKPTWIHLISTDDFLEATKAAIIKEDVKGIYHLGDDGYQTLQEFADIATQEWGCKKAWRMPVWLIYGAAALCELQSKIFGTPSPLTKDFITIGMQSYYGDTTRMRRELLTELKYRTIEEGKATL